MHPVIRWTSSTAATLAAVMLVAACGSSSSTTTAAKSTAAAQSVAATATTAAATTPASGITTSSIGTLKTQDGVLVTGTGNRTLYYFKPDKATTTSAHGKSSTCYGPCANVWPPVLVTATPSVSSQAKAALIGVTKRKDGTTQVTYNGLPLYYYAADTKAGQVTGNHLKDGFGFWGALLANGQDTPSS